MEKDRGGGSSGPLKDPYNESVQQNDKWLQWNQNWFNDSVMKMGEIESAELEKMKARVEKKVPSVMNVAVWKIYWGLSEGEMEC